MLLKLLELLVKIDKVLIFGALTYLYATTPRVIGKKWAKKTGPRLPFKGSDVDVQS